MKFHKKLDEQLGSNDGKVVPVRFGEDGPYVGHGRLSDDGKEVRIDMTLDPKSSELMQKMLTAGLFRGFSIAPDIKPPKETR